MHKRLQYTVTAALLAQSISLTYASPYFVAVGSVEQNLMASITPQLSTQGTTALSSDNIQLSFDFTIPPNDVGLESSLFVIAKANNQHYILDTQGNWALWDGKALVAAKNLKLSAKEHFVVIDNKTLPAGEYQVFAAYLTKHNAIKYTEEPINLIVFAANKSTLHAVKQAAVLKDYLIQGVTKQLSYYYDYNLSFSGPSFSNSSASFTSPTAPISGTNLQEMGVDESDRIKTDGETLFSLKNCKDDNLNTCLYRYHLQTSPAQSTETGQLQLTNKKEQPYNYYGITGFGNLYLAKHSDRPSKSLIWLKNETSWVEQDTAFLHWKKYNNNTAIKFITADQPNQLAVHHELTIEGKLLSSRLINGVLYLLTQNSPRHYIPWVERDLNLPIVKPPLDFFFPALTENKGDKQSFVNASDCYIPPQNSARYNRPVISVLTAIPVDNPSQLTSRCVAGDVDTFYASTQAVYLVTSRYSSAINGSLTYTPNYTTDIHKFSLKNASIDYLGSGQVEGHLGWQQDKKSFRFGEDKNTLRVATSLGSNWSETNPARTKITILEEDAATQSLKEVGALDYLGKPGERLYAARFMGDRGYLVTFRVTDPLIVLDLSQTNDPKVLGELEVNGYSDYLQPIGNHYLLGIGKDAIAAPNISSTTRGAFVQGVKLSLFDVSNAENLKEVSSMVIGKRGSESTVSSDHHGLTLLKTDDSHYKLTLPIELHENANKPYPYTTTRSTDSVHYNWTHTGLYSFDINTDAANPIQLNGKLISDSFQMNAQDLTPYSLLNDRSVIQGDTVHYIHGDKILSSEIKDLSQ